MVEFGCLWFVVGFCSEGFLFRLVVTLGGWGWVWVRFVVAFVVAFFSWVLL